MHTVPERRPEIGEYEARGATGGNYSTVKSAQRLSATFSIIVRVDVCKSSIADRMALQDWDIREGSVFVYTLQPNRIPEFRYPTLAICIHFTSNSAKLRLALACKSSTPSRVKAKKPQKSCAGLAGHSTATNLKRGASLGCVIPPSALAHSSIADNLTAQFVSMGRYP